MSNDDSAQHALDEYLERSRQEEERKRLEQEKLKKSRRILTDSQARFAKEERKKHPHITADQLQRSFKEEQDQTHKWKSVPTINQADNWLNARQKPQIKKRRAITQEQDRLIRRAVRKNPKARLKDVREELGQHKWKRGQPKRKDVAKRLRRYKKKKARKLKRKRTAKERKARKRKRHDDWVRKQKGLKPRKRIPKMPPITGRFVAAFICEYVDRKTGTRMISPHDFIVKHRDGRSKLYEAYRFHRIHYPRHTVLEPPEIGDVQP